MSAFLVFSVLVLSGCFNRVVSSLNEEGLALLALKSSIKEDPEGSLSNWNYSDQTPCSWNGITCKAQKVVSISIPRKKLSGFLPDTLGSLAELRHVNLRSNKLAGNLPPELFKLQGLQSLVLYENSFSGPLQFEVGNLVYLQTLDLSRNFFNGSLPPSLVQCRRLRYLDFSGNNFSGSLPSGLGHNLTFLEKLDLSYNFFTGSIPGDMGYLSNLQGTLDLSHNTLDGLIPASLGNLPEKVYIDLTYNNLSGPIPQNGALVNRGPTAFVGNPALCGPPLKSLCSSGDEATSPTSFPYIPSNHRLPGGGGTAANSGHGLSKAALIAIIIGDVIGICVIGLLFSCCYSTFCAKKKGENGHGGPEKDGYGGRKDCLCFRKEESETQSEHVDRCELVALDGQVGFDLDELLKAPAFVLGKSGIGIVYRVVLEDGLTLAVRRLGEGGSQRFKEFKTEVEAIGRLRHPNIVTLRAYYWSDDEKLLIYDFIRNGNLGSAIHGKSGSTDFTPLSWPARLKIMKGVAKGLLHLHEYSPKKYVHSDLKPTNVLLAHDMEPKISDFGLARLAHITDGPHSPYSSRMVPDRPGPESISIVSGPTLGSYYQAPEAPKALKPSQKWDVYSYGVILLEMLTGRAPMARPGDPEAVDLVQWVQACIDQKKPVGDVLDPTLARDSDKEEEMIVVLKTAMACTHVGPEKRPSMRNVWDALERLPVSED